jgi:hypothetical protein
MQFPKRRIFYFLEHRTMGKDQNPSNVVCYTSSSEPFRIYSLSLLGKFKASKVCPGRGSLFILQIKSRFTYKHSYF